MYTHPEENGIYLYIYIYNVWIYNDYRFLEIFLLDLWFLPAVVINFNKL